MKKLHTKDELTDKFAYYGEKNGVIYKILPYNDVKSKNVVKINTNAAGLTSLVFVVDNKVEYWLDEYVEVGDKYISGKTTTTKSFYKVTHGEKEKLTEEQVQEITDAYLDEVGVETVDDLTEEQKEELNKRLENAECQIRIRDYFKKECEDEIAKTIISNPNLDYDYFNEHKDMFNVPYFMFSGNGVELFPDRQISFTREYYNNVKEQEVKKIVYNNGKAIADKYNHKLTSPDAYSGITFTNDQTTTTKQKTAQSIKTLHETVAEKYAYVKDGVIFDILSYDNGDVCAVEITSANTPSITYSIPPSNPSQKTVYLDEYIEVGDVYSGDTFEKTVSGDTSKTITLHAYYKKECEDKIAESIMAQYDKPWSYFIGNLDALNVPKFMLDVVSNTNPSDIQIPFCSSDEYYNNIKNQEVKKRIYNEMYNTAKKYGYNLTNPNSYEDIRID